MTRSLFYEEQNRPERKSKEAEKKLFEENKKITKKFIETS